VSRSSATAKGVTSLQTDLQLRLDTPLPSRLPVGRATAVFCLGTCFHRHQAIRRLEILVDGRGHAPTACRMPRPDLFRELHPTLKAGSVGRPGPDPDSGADPEVRCYRSGFWATLPIEARTGPGQIELELEATLDSGRVAAAQLGRIDVVEPSGASAHGGGTALIAICMATFDPDPDLFRTQIDSIRAQTETDWVCLVSDDCSAPESYELIEATIAGDPRFVVSRSETNLGFYRNFERALRMVPAEAGFVALCDQDDRWYPDKLEMLRRAISGAQLAYSDTRLVDASGHVLAGSLWERRRNNHTNFASMLIANTVPGAASLMRREVVDLALPFPDAPGDLFHDHWLSVVAMASGELSYVDRPLYDYVQHRHAVQGKMVGEADATPGELRGAVRRRLHAVREAFTGWRAAYFHGYVTLALQAEVLRLRSSSRIPRRKRRTLSRIVTGEQSPLSFAWLVVRPLRAAFGRGETLGAEMHLVKGILWRHIVALRARGRETPEGSAHDSSLSPPGSFDQERLRRWRALR
jgi:glycosyltransferase involved in cell wall biosynthesis